MLKREKMEVKFYKFLGVEKFRKLVFLLEKMIHIKDKGKNINYHPKSSTLEDLKEFKKYLYYNGFIHVKNLCFLMFLLLIKLIFIPNFVFVYFLLIPLIVKDSYCIMLQRYNYINLSEIIKKKEMQMEKRRNQIHKRIKIIEKQTNKKVVCVENINKEQLSNFIEFLQGKSDIIINNNDLETLLQIKQFLTLITQENYKNASFEKEESFKIKTKIKEE